MSASIYDIPVKKITGEAASLGEFKGKVAAGRERRVKVRADAAI